MGEVVNLRQARKTKARIEAAKAADANRLAHGRSKVEKSETAAREAIESRRLEGHRREPARDDG